MYRYTALYSVRLFLNHFCLCVFFLFPSNTVLFYMTATKTITKLLDSWTFKTMKVVYWSGWDFSLYKNRFFSGVSVLRKSTVLRKINSSVIWRNNKTLFKSSLNVFSLLTSENRFCLTLWAFLSIHSTWFFQNILQEKQWMGTLQTVSSVNIHWADNCRCGIVY